MHKPLAEDRQQSQAILFEQVKILFKAIYYNMTSYLIICGVVVFVVWDVAPHDLVLTWAGVLTSILVIRVAVHFFIQHRLSAENARAFGRYLVLSAGITGLVWGIGTMLMFQQVELMYQIFILFIIAGLGVAAFASTSIYLPSLFATISGLILPLGIKLFFIDGDIYRGLAIVTLLFVFSLFLFSINLNRSLLESLRLRFENTDLVTQLRFQKEEAEHANEAKSKFLAAASHDLRQPLHALTLFTSVLDESIQSPKVRQVVEQINASVRALQSLFNALLDISRLDAGVMKDEKTRFDLQTLFTRLANDFDPLAREQSLHINWPDAAYTVYSDPSLLEQILRNYIANAIRYTDSGEITIRCEMQADGINIQVIDTGIGIPAEEQQAVFEEFHQLGNPERDRNKGLGLGLAIVQRTAKLLGHPIKVTSELGKGSTFGIIVEAGELDEHAQEIPAVDPGDNQTANGAVIVVIDDEESIREGMRNLLQIWGCDVITASNKEEAISQLRQQDKMPDGIIADYRLRDNQTGIEAIHALHAEYEAQIPALIVTGDIAMERLREVNDSGFQVLHKPVAPVKLRTFLRNIQLRKP